ncbi:MAG: Ig-like domain-containing protein [Pseudomonadota bacterium]
MQLNIDPELTLWGTELNGAMTLGSGNAYESDFVYAALKLTDDVTLETLDDILDGDLGELRQLFDDALVEIPVGLFEEVAEVAVDGIRNSLGGFAGQTDDLAWNEIRLFTLDDVEIGADEFVALETEFQIEIGEPDAEPSAIFDTSESDSGLTLADGSLFARAQGTLAKLDGDIANVDTIRSVEGGGLFALGRDGALAFDAGGSYEHVGEGDVAAERFSFTLMGDDGLERGYVAEIRVAGENDLPDGVADSVTLAEDGVLSFDPAANDTDIDEGDVLRVIAVGDPDNGTATVDAAGVVTFTPDPDFFGTTTLSYTVSDEHGGTDTSSVEITVVPVGDIVRPGDDALQVSESASGQINVLANDIEVDGDGPLRVEGVSAPASGALADVAANSTLNYDPNGAFDHLAAGETARETLNVTVTDDVDGSATSTVEITIEGENDAPVAEDDVAATDEDTPILLSVLDNDTDVDASDVLGFDPDAAPTAEHGTVTIEGQQLRYTPDVDFYGTDIITYQITDGNGGTSQAKAEVAVRSIADNTLTADASDEIAISGTSSTDTRFVGSDGVQTIRNTTEGQDFDLTAAEFESVEALDGAGGTLRIAADGILDLSPLTSIQNLSGIRAAGGAETIIGSIFADQVDGGAGIDTYRVAGSFFDFDVEVSGPGAATITRDGVTDTLAGMERIVFDDVTLATDGNSSPFTRDDTITLVQTGRLTVTSAALVANDIDIDGDTITVTDLTGTDEITVAASANGFVLQATSALAHMVEEDQLYVDLTYTARDGQGGESTGTVTVKIEGANDTPTVPTSALRLGENEGANGNLLEYAVDPDTGSVMTVTAVAGAELRDGVFALTLPTGVIATIHPDGTYELAASDANDGLARGQTAFDGVRFTVTDDAGAETAGLLQLTIMGENDQVNDPVTRVETDALTEIDVAADVGALSDASDPDAGSGFAMTSPVSGAVIDGDAGGTFTLQSDGSFSFDPGHDFFDLGIDDVRTTTATYTVLDNEGAATEGTISVDVKGADIAPFLSDDARYDALSSFVFGELDATTVVGSFYQIGGVDVTEALFAELDEATGFDINDWLDFTLIDLNKRLHLSSTFEDGLTFVLEDVEEAEGALAALNDDFNEIVGDALSAVEAVADTVLPLDLGPIEQTLLFDATVGLDLELGWDIDIPTLGKTAVFQPFELTLNTPDRAVADDFLVLNSAEFVAHSPTSVTETVGVGSFQVIAGLEMPDTQVDGLGVGIRTSDFLGFELDGLASASVTLDRVFTLDEAIETTKTLVLDAVGTIVQAIPADIPFDIEKVLSTILSLDLGNLVEGLFSSELDIEPLLDALQAEGFEAKLDGILDFIATLSESGSNVNATIAVGGAIATETEIFTLTNRAMFNEFDGFDDDGVGYFDMDDGAGGTVEVQAQPLQDIRDFLGIDENVNAFARALNEIGLSPVEGAVVQVAAPIGNVEQIEGFETLEDGSRDTASRDGEQVIEIVQETRLIDVDVDLDSLGQALIDKALELATGDGASPASTIVGIAQALGVEQQEILEEGIRLDIELRPAQLVVATANGIIDNFNLVAEALGGLVGVDAPTIDRIAESDVLDDVDAAIDSSISVLTDGFDLLGDLMAGPAEVLQDLLDAGGLTSIDDVLGAFSTTSAIDTALDLLDDIDNFSILGFDVIPSSAVDPIRAIMQVARDVAQGVDSAADAVADVISAIEGAVIDLLNFDPTEGFSAILEEVASVLKDAARGGDISVTTAFDVLTAQLDAGLDLIQVATFNPDHVTVNYEIGEFNLDAGLGEDAGFFVAGEAGDEITGTATYGYSGAVDYEYYLRLDVNPTFEFFGVDISGEFAIGENIEFSFDEEYALAAIGETSPLNGDGFASQFDEALFELNFDFLTEIGQMVQGQLAAAVDLPLGDVVDLEAGEILLFALDDVELEVDRFTSVEEEFTVSLIDNFVPVIDHASFTVAEDATLTGVFAARDENDLLSELTFSVADGQGPAHGTLTFGDEGAFTYQPDADFNGVETFAITVADGADRAETPATITVDVQSVEDAPRAPDQAIRVPAEGTLGPVTGTLQATDADDQTLSFTLVTAPDNGTFALAGDGSYTFTPDAGFSAASSFQVQVSDGVSGPVNFIVTIGPNTAPVIGDATLVVSENTPLEFTPTATDAEGDEVTFREAASLRSRNGTLTQLESGAFSYVPMAGFWGVDSFALAATDGQLSDEAVFTVNVARDAADDDDVEGSSAAEDINGSQGADVIAPGLGADRVTTSGGADKVIGDLEELDGDTLLDLTSEDRIVVQNAGFEPQDVTFDRVAGRLSFDSDGDGVADATLHVEDVKPDERFLVFETEEGTQAVLAQELPYLAEDRAVSNSNINGIVVQEFLNGGDGVSFNVTISSASGAAFLNSVGYYEVAENGDISNVRLLTSNAQGGGDFVIGSLAEGQTLGFFLAQNAHSATSGAILFDILDASGGTANVFADDSFVFRIDGEDHVGAVFHSFDADMNTNNIQHVLSGVSQDGISMFVGFEDQLNGGDRDYQDVLFDIDRIVDIA